MKKFICLVGAVDYGGTNEMKSEELIILHEDNHVIVVLKPQNVPSQEDSTGDKDMLTLIKEYLKEKHNKLGNVYLGLVHRLDRPTGGVMVFAKTSKAAARLSEQMRKKEIEKKYLCVTIGRPRDNRGRLINYLEKVEKNNRVRIAPATNENAKEAILDYVVCEDEGGYSLIEVSLVTGRPHQVRVQMANAGAVLFGDVKYGANVGKGQNLALFAYHLKFKHPTTDQILSFKVFPPETNPWTGFNVAKFINVAKPE